MNQQQLEIIQRGIALTIQRSSRGFRTLNGLVLVGICAAFIGSVVAQDLWPAFPRWLVYVLAVALVIHALVHTAVIRSFEEGERRAWQEFLKYLPASEGVSAPTAAKAVSPVPTDGSPVLRVFRPDQE